MRVLLVPNTANPRAVSAVQELSVWCAGRGIEFILETDDAREVGMVDRGVTASEIGDIALAVALGGDGTILKAVHLLGDVEVPLLGVKYGRLGFLSGSRPETMREAIESALSGEARIERRATLTAKVVMDGRTVGRYRALNEVVLSRGASGRVVVLDVSIDGVHLERLRADGLIVATATGSTAYALSAGGPVISPSFAGMAVVPIAPHTLQARALLTDPSEAVEITLPEPARSDACIVVDGDAKPCRQAIESVTVSRSDHDVLLVKHDGYAFYHTVSTEFFGG
ncbi:MAG: ATP-NAD kinase [Actinobacteria bacterium HGW-Actinobacteria-7]|jgi:NAD+ kinase|nr:MAG: ATP-NAD kinase [Actinobacteria bacterium HGW-Actinobacteria-7]